MFYHLIEKYKAKVEYVGEPNPRPRKALLFKVNAIIEVTQKEHDWWRGKCDDQDGWFPSQFVEEVRQVSSKSKYNTSDNM
jgi:hypothetical protein